MVVNVKPIYCLLIFLSQIVSHYIPQLSGISTYSAPSTLRDSTGTEIRTSKESVWRFQVPTSVQCGKRLYFVKVVSTKQLWGSK